MSDWLLEPDVKIGPIEGEEGYAEAGRYPYNSSSQALESSRIVKAGAGTLYGFSGFSNLAASQFILAFDAQPLATTGGPPANGTIPVVVISTLQATNNFSYAPGRYGRYFYQGIILCCSTTAATLTLGAANCWFDAQYI